MCFQPFVNKQARGENKSLLYFFGSPHLSPAALDVALCDVTKGSDLSSGAVLSSQLGVGYILRRLTNPPGLATPLHSLNPNGSGNFQWDLQAKRCDLRASF